MVQVTTPHRAAYRTKLFLNAFLGVQAHCAYGEKIPIFFFFLYSLAHAYCDFSRHLWFYVPGKRNRELYPTSYRPRRGHVGHVCCSPRTRTWVFRWFVSVRCSLPTRFLREIRRVRVASKFNSSTWINVDFLRMDTKGGGGGLIKAGWFRRTRHTSLRCRTCFC